jgi:hypothetical protein
VDHAIQRLKAWDRCCRGKEAVHVGLQLNKGRRANPGADARRSSSDPHCAPRFERTRFLRPAKRTAVLHCHTHLTRRHPRFDRRQECTSSTVLSSKRNIRGCHVKASQRTGSSGTLVVPLVADERPRWNVDQLKTFSRRPSRSLTPNIETFCRVAFNGAQKKICKLVIVLRLFPLTWNKR